MYKKTKNECFACNSISFLFAFTVVLEGGLQNHFQEYHHVLGLFPTWNPLPEPYLHALEPFSFPPAPSARAPAPAPPPGSFFAARADLIGCVRRDAGALVLAHWAPTGCARPALQSIRISRTNPAQLQAGLLLSLREQWWSDRTLRGAMHPTPPPPRVCTCVLNFYWFVGGDGD